jgi:plasminogen activator inhibitor 1 RNA-binding protein
MASQINRFAALSPDFEEEEQNRKKVLDAKAKKEAQKAKHEEEIKKKAEGVAEGKGFEVSEGRGPAERGKTRGTVRGTRGGRGRGGYSRGGAVQYVPAEQKERHIEGGNYHFQGNNDPVHPFDRHSGTGRGTEVSKRGSGRHNWGTHEDDLKYQDKLVEGQEEATKAEVPKEEAPKEEGKPVDEKEQAKNLSKREKKLRKKDKKVEEVKEESLDKDGTALTYTEYKAMMAEKQKELPKKQVDLKAGVNTGKVAGLVAYEKPKGKVEPAQKAPKKKETEEDEAEPEKDVLGIKNLTNY